MSEELGQNEVSLPETVTVLKNGEKTCYVIGTAHVSQKSVEDVENVINTIEPDSVVVELCASRHETLNNPDRWNNMNVFEVIKSGKSMFLLANLILSSFQKKVGEKMGVKPGSEMVKAIECAKEKKAELILGDRDVQTTLKRTWAGFKTFEKMKISFQMMSSVFVGVDVKEDELERMKEKDMLHEMLEDLGKSYPVVKERLIHERDLFLMHSIYNSPGDKVVAVVGAGHVPGIEQHWGDSVNLQEITEIPKPGSTGKIIKWAIPILIIIAFIYGFYSKDVGWDLVKIWVLVNGVLSALGALCALAHPITIATAFVAAPLTSLNPLVAAGWVSGLMEAFIRKPTVSDCHDLQNDISSLKGFYKNRITRVLLVVALSNFGSMLGTWIAAAGIVKILN